MRPETKRMLFLGGAVIFALIVLGSVIGAVIGLVVLIIKGIVGAVVGLLGFAFKSVFNLLLVGGLVYLAYRWYQSRRLPGSHWRRMASGEEIELEDYHVERPERGRRW